MNINNFEEHINSTILERGYDYYINNKIVEFTCEDDNTYLLEVDGTEEYQVVIKLDDKGKIIYSECNCPYDYGVVCKHEAAAYYKILDYICSGNNKKKADKSKKKSSLKEVLNGLSKEKLIDIITDLAKKDAILKNSIILKYSTEDSEIEIKNCKKLIQSIVKKYCGREGYITWGRAAKFVDDISEILDKAENTEDLILAVDIAFLVLDEAMKAFDYADDSDGDIGMLVSETMTTISQIVEDSRKADMKVREKLFAKILKKSQSYIFDGWADMRLSMIEICRGFSYEEKFRNVLVEELNSLIKINCNKENMRYYNEHILIILYEIIDEFGTEEESEKFIRDNIKYSSFREILIDKYNSKKDYDKVIELTIEGEKNDRMYLGLVHKWQKIRYDAYKNKSMKEEQKELGKELLIQGDFEYYNDLKQLVDDDKDFYENIKQILKNSRDWRSKEVLIKILYAEDDFEELLEYVKKNPSSIEEHAEKLKESYIEEVISIYRQFIIFEAEHASNRSNYKCVCAIIKRFKKIAGKDEAETVINELKARYMRKPAFLDELSKIK
ncbi:hypothetical protein [uncultured Clostridium sp.]|uniref:SWIM zinc finger family protein n=1 Tax=uncultured Clostridium sp. TaxID=59620 RepID=UPI0025D3C7DF|nr:hypothetical protein [uncultured Clostridium sp.]